MDTQHSGHDALHRSGAADTHPAGHGGTDHFAVLGGRRFHYVRWGDPAAPPVLALHGLRSYAETFADLALALQPHFQLLAPDQRGRGRSDWDPERRYDTMTYVADLEALVDAVSLTRFDLLGHSMGGANAIVYAARHPHRVRRLVIEDMGPGASASSAGAERIRRELASTPAGFRDLDDARAFWRSIRPNASAQGIESRVRHSLRQHADGTLVWRHDQAGIAEARARIAPTDLWPHLEAVACPMLLVRGGDSDFLSDATVQAMRRRLPALQVRQIEGAGHYVHDDQPQAFHRAVRDFLSEAA